MFTNLDKYIDDVKNLVGGGVLLLKLLEGENDKLTDFREGYEIWYSEAHSLVKFILPDRLKDFELYYENSKGDSIRKAITYAPPRNEGIKLEFNYEPAKQVDLAKSLFINQLNIVKSCKKRFESSLFDIQQLVQADLFDSELGSARELNKKGFVRGAGAMAGVVLEKHLAQVCLNHSVKFTKKDPTINDFNQPLKDAGVIEVKDWRFIQRLADLRNLCDHNKKKEPTKQDVEELIDGTEKVSKTIY